MSQENINTLEQALKANKKLSKLYAKQIEAQDRLKSKSATKVAELLESLTPEVRALVKTGE